MVHSITSVQLSGVRCVGASGASKATQTLLTAKAKKRKIDLNNEVDNFFAERNKKITELAAHYCKNESDIRALLCNTSQLKAHRRPNLYNGVLHQRALNLQERGISKHLKELQAELDNDLLTGKFSYESISKTEREHLINQVLRKRHDRRRSMHATTEAAQIDTKLTAKRIGDELLDLFERTGVRAFAFFARGSADDPSRAHCIDSDDAPDFFTQWLDFTAPHFMRKFEQWSCTLDEGARLRNGVNAVRKEVSGMLTDRLRKITKDPKAKMDYVGFRVKVMGKYGVELVSFELPGTRPGTWNVDLARFVWDRLVDRTIDFVQMTPDQRDDLAAELNAERAAQGYASSRTQCSDKGKKRGPRKEKSSVVAGKKSKNVVEDSNNDNTDREDDGDENSSDEERVVCATPRRMSAAVAARTVPSPLSGGMPPIHTHSPYGVLAGHQPIQGHAPRPSNPASHFPAPVPSPAPTPNPLPVAQPAPVPNPNATPAPAPISNQSPDPAPAPIPNQNTDSPPAPIPNQNADPAPAPGPLMLGSFPDHWAGAIGMNDGFDPFGGLGFPDPSQMPVLPSSFDLDLEGIHHGMEEYRSGSVGMGMSACNGTPLWPILNMPAASPSTAEKRGRDEGEEDENADQPALQRRRHQNAVPRKVHKVRSDKGKVRKVRSDKGKKCGPRST
ncbi:hypothetical protein B0H14DRAFT_3424640 [Mycena olivaceomarginata]|nr:hypothetical protein B0H14DRAFT_3424640 [Mycena olivaceomarginata]